MILSYPSAQKTTTLLLRLFLFVFILCIPYLIIEQSHASISGNRTFRIIYSTLAVLLSNILIIAYAIRRIKKQEPFNLLHDLKSLPIFYLPIAFLGIVALVFMIDPLEQILPIPEFLDHFFTELLQLRGYSFFFLVIAGPITEEILFRGVILKSFLKNYSPLKAILLSSMFFGIIHLNLTQFVTAFIAGIFLGYLYWQTKSLSLCILMHIAYNAIVFVNFHLLDIGFSIESAISSTILYLVLYFFAAITLTTVILTIYKRNLPSIE